MSEMHKDTYANKSLPYEMQLPLPITDMLTSYLLYESSCDSLDSTMNRISYRKRHREKVCRRYALPCASLSCECL